MSEQLSLEVGRKLDPSLQTVGQYLADATALAIEKATLHASDPKTYPLGDVGADSIEAVLLKRFQQLSQPKQQKAIATANSRIADGGRAKRLGGLSAVDLKN